MRSVADLIPWKVTDISLRPHREFWSFNPSIHYDGQVWRCVLRNCDYCMVGGRTQRSRKARGGVCTKNAMVVLDPRSWRPVELYKMRERDGAPRGSSDNVGFEDLRLFRTDRGGLQGIAASQHLARSDRRAGRLPEQVILSFDHEYAIVDARPIRGAWSEQPQKNWVPFDGVAEPRFLYAIDRGTLFDDRGELRGDAAGVLPASTSAEPPRRGDERATRRARERAEKSELDRRDRDERDETRARRSGSDKIRLDPASAAEVEREPWRGLRGGTQLVRVGDDTWLGVGHAMRFVDGQKYYYHAWYAVDSRGQLVSASPPMKLASVGIEFAAGLAIDGDRAVVSFGVEDAHAKIGETRLSAVVAQLRPVDRSA